MIDEGQYPSLPPLEQKPPPPWDRVSVPCLSAWQLRTAAGSKPDCHSVSCCYKQCPHMISSRSIDGRIDGWRVGSISSHSPMNSNRGYCLVVTLSTLNMIKYWLIRRGGRPPPQHNRVRDDLLLMTVPPLNPLQSTHSLYHMTSSVSPLSGDSSMGLKESRVPYFSKIFVFGSSRNNIYLFNTAQSYPTEIRPSCGFLRLLSRRCRTSLIIYLYITGTSSLSNNVLY